MAMIDTHIAEAMKETDPHLLEFERFDKAGAGARPSWVYPIRKAGIARFAELGFPTLEDEDWRFTNVSPIAKLPFRPRLDPGDRVVKSSDLAKFHFAELKASRLVFVDGFLAPELSTPQKRSGFACSLATALAENHA